MNDDEPIAEWEADIAFLTEWDPRGGRESRLGRDGFFNQFTVTMHGGIPGMMLEGWEAFAER